MTNCKLVAGLGSKRCAYAVAGAKALYLANFYEPVFSTTATAGIAGKITYKLDTDGKVTNIYLPEDEVFFPLIAEEATINFTDILQAGANNNKYRQHSVTALTNTEDMFAGTNRDDLSLGKFIAIAVDNADQVFLLGAKSGIEAPANGVDYNSGTAVGDAVGHTVLLQGVQKGATDCAMKVVSSSTVITPIFEIEP